MSSIYSVFDKLRFSRKPDSIPGMAPTNQPTRHSSGPIGDVGEVGERISEQISRVSSRIEDLQTLREEFAAITQPLNEFVVAHQKVVSRVQELQALLSKEKEEIAVVRGELHQHRARVSRAEENVAALEMKLESQKLAASEHDESYRMLQLQMAERETELSYLREQAMAAAERSDSLERVLSFQSDSSLKLEAELAAQRATTSDLLEERTSLSAEVERLQSKVDKLTPELTLSKREGDELRGILNSAKSNTERLESELLLERETRRTEHQRRCEEIAAIETQRSSLAMQLEGALSRHAAQTKMFEESKSYGLAKAEEARKNHRLASEALNAAGALERRVAALAEELTQAKAKAAEREAGAKEVSARCDMLTRALAAKDAHVEQTNARLNSAKEQLEAAERRFEQERGVLEDAYRKLIEQYQSERAERALAQGALTIARASKEKVLAEMELMKRSASTRGHNVGEAPQHSEVWLSSTESSNVHRFNAERE